jgi:hypothetical protein
MKSLVTSLSDLKGRRPATRLFFSKSPANWSFFGFLIFPAKYPAGVPVPKSCKGMGTTFDRISTALDHATA